MFRAEPCQQFTVILYISLCTRVFSFSIRILKIELRKLLCPSCKSRADRNRTALCKTAIKHHRVYILSTETHIFMYSMWDRNEPNQNKPHFLGPAPSPGCVRLTQSWLPTSLSRFVHQQMFLSAFKALGGRLDDRNRDVIQIVSVWMLLGGITIHSNLFFKQYTFDCYSVKYNLILLWYQQVFLFVSFTIPGRVCVFPMFSDRYASPVTSNVRGE